MCWQYTIWFFKHLTFKKWITNGRLYGAATPIRVTGSQFTRSGTKTTFVVRDKVGRPGFMWNYVLGDTSERGVGGGWMLVSSAAITLSAFESCLGFSRNVGMDWEASFWAKPFVYSVGYSSLFNIEWRRLLYRVDNMICLWSTLKTHCSLYS